MATGVVITGIGVISPIAHGREAYWSALEQGTPGFRPITLFDTSNFPVRIAGEITDFDPASLLGKKGLRDLDRSTRLICCAAKLALDDSGLAVTEESSGRIGVSLGTTFGSLHSISQFDRSGLVEGPRFVNPSHFPSTVINSPASQVSIRFKIKGFNTTISTGACSGVDAIAYAADYLSLGRADSVLAGGVEELCEESFEGFHRLGCLPQRQVEPLCCPFDRRRSGFLPSEGAAMLVLEDELHARARGATVFARILGFGNVFDPDQDEFRGTGRGLAAAVQQALQGASLRPGDIDCIYASANSSRGLDVMEARVFREIFGDRASRIPTPAIKSMIGETYSASGALAAAAAVGGLQRACIPPTVNYAEKDSDCDLDCVPGRARQHRIHRILVTSADASGQNAALVIGR